MIKGSGSWSLLGWIIAFTILTTIALLLRYWSARLQKRTFFVDDGLVIAAYLGMLAQQGLAIWGICNGLGNHITDMTADNVIVVAKLVPAVSVTWIFSSTVIKLAVLWLHTRLFSTQVFKRFAFSLMLLSTVFGIVFLCLFLSRCHPVSQEWSPVPGGWCRDLTTTEVASSSTNLGLDILIICLPMPWLWGLHMPVSNKIVVTIMFSFGFATIGIMCYRITCTVGSNVDPDPMISIAQIGLLSNLEIWLGIIVASTPTMAPVLRTYVQPALSRLSEKLYGSSSPCRDKGIPHVQLRTFRGSGRIPHAKSHKNYPELSEFTYIEEVSDKLYLVEGNRAKLQSDCEYGNIGA